MKTALTLIITGVLITATAFAESAKSPYDLYTAGDIPGARAAYERGITDVRTSGDEKKLWSWLMSTAWFEDETGNHRKSLDYSNEALSIATRLNDPFMIGRSLDWLGWAYSSMGLYKLALEFYGRAVEIGAPKGEVKIAYVWGLAAQEMGAIYFKMGDLHAARTQLQQTYSYAQEHGISVGVAEGGVHLAEIALTEGKLDEADRFAQAALQAAVDCNCSPFNLSRARVLMAKVAWEKAQARPEMLQQAIRMVQSTHDTVSESGNTRVIAEAKLLLSRTVPASEFERKYELVSKAFELLAESESELRGTAEAAVGKTLLEADQTALAAQYLKQGYKVNRELFRQVDVAYVTADLSRLRGIEGNRKKEIQTLKRSIDRALSIGALPLALEGEEKLAAILEQHGYRSLALRRTQNAIKLTERLAEQNQDPAVKGRYKLRAAALYERAVQLGLSITNEQHAEPNP